MFWCYDSGYCLLANADSCALRGLECRGHYGEILFFPDGTWGEKWRKYFQIDFIHHNTSLAYRNILQLGRNWDANVLFAYRFLQNLIWFMHLHATREILKCLKCNKCSCLLGTRASSSFSVNQGCLRSCWPGLWSNRGNYNEGGKQSSRLGLQACMISGMAKCFSEERMKMRVQACPLCKKSNWNVWSSWMDDRWLENVRIKGEATEGDMLDCRLSTHDEG